jgi:hypothetical protein
MHPSHAAIYWDGSIRLEVGVIVEDGEVVRSAKARNHDRQAHQA